MDWVTLVCILIIQNVKIVGTAAVRVNAAVAEEKGKRAAIGLCGEIYKASSFGICSREDKWRNI
jgi:hypothetical protein